MNKLEELEEVIQNAVSDIICENCKGKFDPEEVICIECWNEPYRDITLEDVIVAHNYNECKGCDGAGQSLGANLGVVECGDCGGDRHSYEDKSLFDDEWFTCGTTHEEIIIWIVQWWELGKPLNQQEQSTIDFFHELLVN